MPFIAAADAMDRLFGTDGIRGIAITDFTCETALQLGKAVATVMCSGSEKPKIVVGLDTRVSGDVLQAALASGICSVGTDAVLVGVVPTPAVAVLVKKNHADAGVMITAGISDFSYNGLKIFGADGFKIDNDTQAQIERLVVTQHNEFSLKGGDEIGHIYYDKDGLWDYIRHILKMVDIDYHGLKVAIDCANGAPSECAAKIFRGLGASVVLINDLPDGNNINRDCGTLSPEGLVHTVISEHCDLGLAFDGDGGRCIAVDELGRVLDGDKLIGIFAAFMQYNKTLRNNSCVVTKMSNSGFYKFARQAGIVITTSKVGGMNVIKEMRKSGSNLGGEKAGNIIFLDDATTSDGLLTGTKLMSVMKKSDSKLSELGKMVQLNPQVLVNAKVTVGNKSKWRENSEITQLIMDYSNKLGTEGRLYVRESGTEPLVRIMIEGKRTGLITEYANNIAAAIERIYGQM